jgi:CMP-N-acetylneuraminic acid synthetase
MSANDDTVVVIPARCGSTRVELKNIRPLAGKPLLAYTVEAALAAFAHPPIVSTDCGTIAGVAHALGARVVMRPPELATATASTESALIHVLDLLELEGWRPAWIMTLPPTSPLRSAETIRRFHDEVRRCPGDQDCLMSVTENRGDFWRMSAGGAVERLFADAPRRQQDREALFEENSAIYLTAVAALRETGSILGRRVRGLAIDLAEGWDINSALDFEIAEALLRRRTTTML